jgi:hypothetical protein
MFWKCCVDKTLHRLPVALLRHWVLGRRVCKGLLLVTLLGAIWLLTNAAFLMSGLWVRTITNRSRKDIVPSLSHTFLLPFPSPSSPAWLACFTLAHGHLLGYRKKLNFASFPNIKLWCLPCVKKKKKKRIRRQRDTIYSFSLTAREDKCLKRDGNCLPINWVPEGLSLSSVDHVPWSNQEEEREATITVW